LKVLKLGAIVNAIESATMTQIVTIADIAAATIIPAVSGEDVLDLSRLVEMVTLTPRKTCHLALTPRATDSQNVEKILSQTKSRTCFSQASSRIWLAICLVQAAMAVTGVGGSVGRSSQSYSPFLL